MAFEQIFTNLGFNWPVALANLINFLIIFWVLKRFAFGPINKILVDRRNLINEGLNNAEQAKKELVIANQKSMDIVNEAKLEAQEVMTDSFKKAEVLMSSAQTKAKIESQAIIEASQIEINSRAKLAEDKLKHKTADLVIRGVEKILQEEMSLEKQEKLVAKLISHHGR